MKIEEYLSAEFARKAGPRHIKDEEHKIQCECVRWFYAQWREFGGLLFAVPNGGRRDAATGAKLKREGVVPGVADLMLFVARKGLHGLCIEMKTPKGRQSDVQKIWQQQVQKQGYGYVVCRGVEEFVEVVNQYLK